MEQNKHPHGYDHENLLDDELDIKTDKPSSSRFLFLLGFFGIFIFAWSGCYNLFQHKFKNNNDVQVPESSLYEPKYK